MKTELNVAVVGLGNRGVSLLKHCILPREGVRVAAVCDVYEDRRERAVKLAVEALAVTSPIFVYCDSGTGISDFS